MVTRIGTLLLTLFLAACSVPRTRTVEPIRPAQFKELHALIKPLAYNNGSHNPELMREVLRQGLRARRRL